METICFTVPSLDTANETTDLSSALLGLSGVEHVDLSDDTHSVSVRYDPAFADRETIRQVITGTGYPYEDPTA